MNLAELQQKYLTLYKHFRRMGIRNKLYMILLTLPAVIYAYLELDGKYKHHHLDKSISHASVVWISIGMEVFMLLLLISIRSFAFVNLRRTKGFTYHFKNELFAWLQTEIPEIDEYIYNQKIHPDIFYRSGLFKSKHSDYVGDDWIKGHFGDIRFEMCELHVFNLFKNIFSGIFVRIRLCSGTDLPKEVVMSGNTALANFETKYKARVLSSQQGKDVFLAIKMNGKFFEGNTPRLIQSVDNHVALLKDLMGLLKEVANKSNR